MRSHQKSRAAAADSKDVGGTFVRHGCAISVYVQVLRSARVVAVVEYGMALTSHSEPGPAASRPQGSRGS